MDSGFVVRKNITVRLTGNSEEVLVDLVRVTGFNVNRLMNELIQNARVVPVESDTLISEIEICGSSSQDS